MSQSIITNAFEQLKAQQAANGSVIVLDKFVFANIPDLDVNLPISRDESWPADEYIVHRQDVGKTGMVNANAVAYSAVLGADVGDFEFNWIGLVSSASDTVCMIVHAPLQKKIKTAAGQQGNVLTRSFLMEYSGASEQTAIVTPVDTWQIDFTARLNGVDERIRVENTDTYGAASFLDDGFKVSVDGGVYSIKRGVGYVAGIRANLLADQELNVTQKPVKIWVDVCWRGTLISTWTDFTKIVVAESLDDYNENDEKHFVYAIAEITADGSVNDLRPVSMSAALSAVSPKKDTIIYFDDKEKAKLTELSAFVRQMLNKASPGEVLNYLGLKDESQSGISDSSIEVQQPLNGSVIRTQHDKNTDLITTADFSTAAEALSAAVSGSKWLHNSTAAFTLKVGTGGQFSRLTDAIDAACKIRPTYQYGNNFCVIELQSGFVLNEQMAFSGGVDLSWIKITSVDDLVYADTSSFTETFFGYHDYKYLLLFTGSAKSPVFSILIRENREASDVVAFIATEASTVYFSPGSGAQYFKGGIEATYGSNIIGLHSGTNVAPVNGYFLCDFSYCIEFCVVAMLNCRVHLPYSLFEHCSGENAVACLWSTVAEFRYSSASYCTGSGWILRDGVIVSIREHKTINCGYGLKAYHGAIINARNHDTNDDGSITDASVQGGFYGCTNGIAADGSCVIEASGTDMRNCGTAVYGTRNCKFTLHSACFDGCTLVVQGTTRCDFALTKMSALGVNGFCSLQSCSLVSWSSSITGPLSTGTRFFDLRMRSDVSINLVNIDTNSSIFVENASELSILACTVGALRMSAYYGSRISMQDSAWDLSRVTTGTTILNVARGSTISAIAQRGTKGEALTCNITPLAINKAGIIYYD